MGDEQYAAVLGQVLDDSAHDWIVKNGPASRFRLDDVLLKCDTLDRDQTLPAFPTLGERGPAGYGSPGAGYLPQRKSASEPVDCPAIGDTKIKQVLSVVGEHGPNRLKAARVASDPQEFPRSNPP